MKKRERSILFADILLGILLCGIFIGGNIRMDDFAETASEALNFPAIEETNPSAAGDEADSETEAETPGAAEGGTGSTDGGDAISATERVPVSQTDYVTEKKKIALTFDDGPNPEYTPILLDGLRERDVQATFFLLGTAVEASPELVEEMYRDGHEIGIHSYEHVNLSRLTEADACAQIRKTCDLIYGITGIRPSFVRPPYGSWLACLEDDFCMIPVFWDVDPLDWATQDSSAVVRKILDDTEEYDIILLHDASESSVQAALQVIDILKQEDFEFVTVEELIFP